jgi:hypothetical protein
VARSRLMEVTADESSLLGEEAPAQPQPTIHAAPAPKRAPFDASLLIAALTALSKRTVVALAEIADLALIASAFALWLMIIANPTPLQLVGAGLYALLVLVAIWMRRK